MGIKNWFSREAKKPAGPEDYIPSAVALTSAPPRRGVAETLTADAESPFFRSVVHRIAESVAQVQFLVTVPPDNRSAVRALHASNITTRASATEGWRDEPEHPALELIENGCAGLSGFACRRLLATYYLETGECFSAKEFRADGTVAALWPIPPTWVVRVPDGLRDTYDLSAGGLLISGVSAFDIIWCKNPNAANPYGRGSGTGMSLGDEIDTDEYVSKWLRAFFFNGCEFSHVIALKGAGDEAVRQLRQQILDQHRGYQKRKLPLVTNADATITQQGDTDLSTFGVIPTREGLRDFIMQSFGIHPAIMGVVADVNKANSLIAQQHMATYLTVPTAWALCDALQRGLMPEFPDSPGVLSFVNPIPADAEFTLRCMIAFPGAFRVHQLLRLSGVEVTGGDSPLDRLASPGQQAVPPPPTERD